MRIAVGSTNPVKHEAVEAVVGEEMVALAPSVSVERERVDSGVSEQPRGRAETVAGAETRAERALAAGDYDLGIGIEGGVAETAPVPGLYLIMWAAATDGERLERAGGPSLRLPSPVADRVRDGAELGPVMDDILNRDGVAREGGAAGALTGGRVDRATALSTAVAGVLGPFAVGLYG